MASNVGFRFRFAHPADRLKRAYSDPGYFERMAQEIGGVGVRVLESKAEQGRMRTVLGMHLDPITPLPGFARKIINGAINLTQTVEWDVLAGVGSMSVVAAHIPYRAVSRFYLDAAEEATDVVSDWTVSFRIPLLASAIERLAIEEIRLRLQAECNASPRLISAAG